MAHIKMTSFDTWFLTGSTSTAKKLGGAVGEQPQAYVRRCQLQEPLEATGGGIRRFYPYHHPATKVVTRFSKLYDQRDIYKASTRAGTARPVRPSGRKVGWRRDCPDCGRPVELPRKKAIFKMSKYAGRLLQHIEENRTLSSLVPAQEMVSFIKSGLEDLCVTRTTFNHTRSL